MSENCKYSIGFRSNGFDGTLFCILDKGHDSRHRFEYNTKKGMEC